MNSEHIDEVVAIEQESFPDPWSRRMFEQELNCPNACQYVATHGTGAGVAGYGCFRFQETEKIAEIMNLAVKPGLLRQQVGTQILKYMIGQLKDRGMESIFLEVRADNAIAVQLYTQFGFRQQRIRKNYYHARYSMNTKKKVQYSRDAIEMMVKLS